MRGGGGLLIVVSIFGFIIAFFKKDERTVFISIALLCAGVQGCFVAFLLDVFTDIRWYLKTLVEQQGSERIERRAEEGN